jgi:hypothetical protein
MLGQARTGVGVVDRLSRAISERREIAAERRHLLTEFREAADLTKQIKIKFAVLAREAQERLARALEHNCEPAPAVACRGLGARAMEAALVAYDEAFSAPSRHGLPSTAAIEAYLAISPEPEAEVRAKLEAALALRREHPVGPLH